jgi:hypothetical protein
LNFSLRKLTSTLWGFKSLNQVWVCYKRGLNIRMVKLTMKCKVNINIWNYSWSSSWEIIFQINFLKWSIWEFIFVAQHCAGHCLILISITRHLCNLILFSLSLFTEVQFHVTIWLNHLCYWLGFSRGLGLSVSYEICGLKIG